jgi:hypothetical protein
MLGIGWSSRMSDELIEKVAQGFVMSWADAQDGDNTLHPDSALMKMVDGPVQNQRPQSIRLEASPHHGEAHVSSRCGCGDAGRFSLDRTR